MKKTLLKATLVATFALVAGYNLYNKSQKSYDISDLALNNVEALADDENPMCPYGCVSDGKGCLCIYWFPTYRDYTGSI